MFPIFAISFFIILYFLELVFTLFAFTIPVAEFMAFLSNILLVFWMMFRVGPVKTFNKLKTWKSGKRFFIQTIAEFIPVLNFFPWAVWFVYSEYKDEQKEKKEKVGGAMSENQNLQNLEDGNALEAEAVDGDEEKGGGVESKEKIRPNSLQRIEEERRQKKESQNQGSDSWITRSFDSKKQNESKDNADVVGKGEDKNNFTKPTTQNKKTIDEEVGGIKTGQESEDYDTDYRGKKMLSVNDPKYYEDILKDQNAKEKEEEQKMREQGIKRKEKSLSEELAQISRIRERAVERYGADSNLVKRLNEKESELNPNTKKSVDELTIGKVGNGGDSA